MEKDFVLEVFKKWNDKKNQTFFSIGKFGVAPILIKIRKTN